MSEVNRVALVVGGGAGIGRATASRLARDGYALAVADLDGDRADAAAAELQAEGAQATAFRANVVDEQQTDDLVASVVEHFGRIDSLVSCAGLQVSTPFEDISLQLWNDVISSHVTSLFLLSRAVIPSMRRQGGGGIVGISSIYAWGIANWTHYSAAKGAILGFVRSLALEEAEHGIRVNAVAPGLIGTSRVRERRTPESIRERATRIPVGRIGEPEEVAETIGFLLSPAASYITGQVIHINGGELLA